MSWQEENELWVESIKNEDERALHELFNILVGTLINQGYVIDTEDVAQNAMMTIWRKLYQFEGRSKFTSWAIRIALNTAKDRAREWAREARGIAYALADEQSSGGIERLDMEMTVAQMAGRLIARSLMSEQSWQAFKMSAIHGLDTDYICEEMEIKPNYLYVLVHRARQAFLNEYRDFLERGSKDV